MLKNSATSSASSWSLSYSTWCGNNTMPEAWRRYESSLADSFNGVRTPLSGAGHVKLDVDQNYFRIEAKSANRGTPKTYIIPRHEWDKASNDARRAGKRPLMAILLEGISVCWLEYSDFRYVCQQADIKVPGPMIYMREIKPTKHLNNLVVKQQDIEDLETMPHYFEFEMLPVLSFMGWKKLVLVGMKEERLVALLGKGDLL